LFKKNKKQTNKQKNTLFTKYSTPVPVHESTTTAFLLLGEGLMALLLQKV